MSKPELWIDSVDLEEVDSCVYQGQGERERICAIILDRNCLFKDYRVKFLVSSISSKHGAWGPRRLFTTTMIKAMRYRCERLSNEGRGNILEVEERAREGRTFISLYNIENANSTPMSSVKDIVVVTRKSKPIGRDLSLALLTIGRRCMSPSGILGKEDNHGKINFWKDDTRTE